MSDFGWVTLATNDTYCLGALVVAHSLKRVKTKHRLAVIITPQVSPSMRDHLSTVFDVIHQVDVLDSKDAANLALLQRPDLGVTFTKIHCWNLTQFKKCIFIDADTLVVQNCDELFERNELSASADPGWPDCFNSGVFVFVPSQKTFNDLLAFASTNGSFDGGDQGLLNMFYSDWSSKDISHHLPFLYNMCSTSTYTYLPALKYYGGNIKIVHFIGSNKPWLQGGTGGSLSGFLHTWWQIFESSVAPNLNKDMSGLAGALGSREKDVIEEQWRKQNWEQGNIDYTGKDSFDNIWQKIVSTMNKVGLKQQQIPPSSQVKETLKKDELASKDMQIMPFTPPEPPKENVIIPLPDKDTSGATKRAIESVQLPTPADQQAQTASVIEQEPTSDVAVAQPTLIQASGQPTFAQKVSSQPPSSAPQVPLPGALVVTPQTPPVVSSSPPEAQPTSPAVEPSPPLAPTVQPAAPASQSAPPPTPAAQPTTPATPAAQPPATPTSQPTPPVSPITDPAPLTTLTATPTPPAFLAEQPTSSPTPAAQPTPPATPGVEPEPPTSPTAQNTPPAALSQPSPPVAPIAQPIPVAAPTAVPTSQPTPPGTPATEHQPPKLVQHPPSTPPVTLTSHIAAPLEDVTLTSATSPSSADAQIKPKESQFPPSSQEPSPLVLDIGQNKAVVQIPPTEETKNEKPFPPPVPKTPTDSVPKTPIEPDSVQLKNEVAKSDIPLEEINKTVPPIDPPKKQDKKTSSPPKYEEKKESNIACLTQGNKKTEGAKKTDGATPPPPGDQSKKSKPQTPPEQSKKGKNKGQAPTPIKDSSQVEQSNKGTPKVEEAEAKPGEQPSKEAQGKNSKQGQKQRKSPPGKSEAPAPPPAKQQKKQPQVATTHPLEEATTPLTPPPSPLDKPVTEEPCSSPVVIAPTPPVSPPEAATTAPDPLSTKLKVEVDAPPTPPAGATSLDPPVPPKRKVKGGGGNNQDKKPNGGGKGKGKK